MSMVHDLTAGLEKNKLRRRKGRGESSGHGKTSGKGNKGAKARQGGPYWKRGHEGGQTSAFRRLPKRGFSNNNFERRYHIVNLIDLNAFEDGGVVDASVLIDAGLVSDIKLPVKILGNGELSKKLTVLAGWYSKSAHAKVLAAGGIAQNAKGEVFEFPKAKKKFIPREPVKKAKKDDAAEGDAKAEAPKADAPKADEKAAE